ncbi:Spy/CpxP family protein refolding chaperone [bacterium]|nr:Spy/CpxP family protein refolding chaperone [bacterium]MBU1651402.1 Spy/CpxP family protein refolding chaperone [bacterium]
MLKKILSAGLMLGLFAGIALANPPGVRARLANQPGPRPDKMQNSPKDRAEIQKRIRTMKIWKLTDELDLTDEQAARFFPKLNVMEDQHDEIRKQMHESMQKLGQLVWDEDAKDSEIEKLLSTIEGLNSQEIAVRQQFRKDVEAILTPAQIGKMILFNQHFPEIVREMIQEMAPQPNRPPPPRSRDGG